MRTENSKINLESAESVHLSEKGLSPAYFCKKAPAFLDRALIEELKAASTRLGNRNVRLCLHEDPASTLHDMIVLIRRGGYYAPHKHISKSETYHIVDGRAVLFLFDDAGKVRETTVLEPSGNFIYRVGINMFHTMVPLTETLVYHESRPGPFAAGGDSVFPSWAPDPKDQAAGVEFTNHFMSKDS